MTAYATYQPLDFATDDNFIAWVKEGGTEGDSFWKEILANAPGKEEVIREAMQIVRQLQFHTREAGPETIEGLWKRIDSNTSTAARHEAKRRTLWSARNIAMAAAAIAILLTGFFFFLRQPQVVKTAYAEQTEHVLPDGSIAFLNADSKLTYHTKGWDAGRTVHLEGEAFFEVEKGSRFEVRTDFGSVRVLGTSFNVRARNSLDVACFTGQVEVAPANNTPPVKLLPGERVYQEEGWMGLQREAFEPSAKKYWRRGEVVFSAARLDEVFEEIERAFDIRVIRSAATGQRKFTGSVSLGGADAAMDDVCTPMQLKYEKEENRFSILE